VIDGQRVKSNYAVFTRSLYHKSELEEGNVLWSKRRSYKFHSAWRECGYNVEHEDETDINTEPRENLRDKSDPSDYENESTVDDF